MDWHIGSAEYEAALLQEAEYWGEEIEKAFQAGIPFSADMRRAQRIFVNRGRGLPQQQVYDPIAEQIMNGELYRYLFDHVVAVSPSCRVLLLTCGPGGLALELARHGHHVHAIDISAKAISIAEQMARENPFTAGFGSVRYTIADLNRIELGKNCYDAVIAWDGLHHIIALDRLMTEIRCALVANGIFIFSDHVGTLSISRIFGGMLYFMLPTFVSYRDKLAVALGGEKKIKEDMTRRSPFEEISSGQIVNVVKRHFQILEEKSHTGIGYRAAIAGDLKWPDRFKHPFLRWLKNLDDQAVKRGWLKGDHILVIASPKG